MANSKGTIVLTGANGGLGAAMVSKIVSTPDLTGYYGVYTVRDANAAPALRASLASGLKSHPHSHDILSLDMTNLAAVREFAATFNRKVSTGDIPPIRALILNAGYLEFTTQTWTDDGFDMTFASTYLGHWLMTLLLLESMDRDRGRIVVPASESHE
jgi:NAD(P)-dependent dehydrogenase (short-subunit alcohol dehydrogenase family)